MKNSKLKPLLFYLKVTFKVTCNFFKVGKNESEFQALLENETPLSLLEECYTSVYSVAKYYMGNSVEPSLVLKNATFTADKDPCEIFFSKFFV